MMKATRQQVETRLDGLVGEAQAYNFDETIITKLYDEAREFQSQGYSVKKYLTFVQEARESNKNRKRWWE